MKFTLPWLKEHLETTATVAEITAKLTDLGLEVERVTDPTAALAGFTVAQVLEAVQHPNAERLKLCTVASAGGVRQVVCGAPNARAGLWGVLAVEGLAIPATGEVLKRAAIRGVESQGMLCSYRELSLGDDHSGIIDLPAENLEVGMPAAEALGLEGPVIELKVTPDRADCFGVLGIARDLAAAGLGRLKPRNLAPVPSAGQPGLAINLSFPAGEERACPLFVGRIIRGVRNGRSPAWLRQRLEAVGIRPISTLVDITNYVMLDLDRPLHVFDAGKLRGDLTVRFAHAGEHLLALDGREYELEPGMVTIADAEGAVSLGGIMGGERTGVSEKTRDVLLEAALFDPLTTAITGRKLDIGSEARTRFERGLDPELVLPSTEYATRIIVELCGGTPGGPVIAGAVPDTRRHLRFSKAQLPRLAGIDLKAADVEQLLRALGFSVSGGPEMYDLLVPSWRQDVQTEACIVEELARLVGYDAIPAVPVRRTTAVGRPALTGEQRRVRAVRRALAAEGLAEAVTYSFIAPEHARLFGHDDLVLMRNPMNSELSAMRPSLLPALLAGAARNVRRSIGSGGLFEVGPRYKGAFPGEQAVATAGLRFGLAAPRQWATSDRAVDALDAKADALAALAATGLKLEAARTTSEAPAWFHPGRSGCLRMGPNMLATFGELHPRILKAFGIACPGRRL